MMEHNLTITDIEGIEEQPSNVCEESIVSSQTPYWHGQIAVIIASNFRCKSIWLNKWDHSKGKSIKAMTFIGFKEDVEIVKEAYIYAISLVKYNIRKFKKRFPRVTTGYLNTYIDGFVDGLYIKFQEQVRENDWGLILVTPVPVETFYLKYNPIDVNPKGRKTKKSNNKSAYVKGYIDGKNFDHARKRIESVI